MPKSFYELRKLKDYYSNKAYCLRHNADPFNNFSCINPAAASSYEKKADKCFYYLLILKGVDPKDIFTEEHILSFINEDI